MAGLRHLRRQLHQHHRRHQQQLHARRRRRRPHHPRRSSPPPTPAARPRPPRRRPPRSSAPPPPPPANTALPTISGTATQGQTLTATNGTWTGSPTSYAYQWQDCNTSGASCANITGATSSSYTLPASDVGHTIRVVVTATNAGGSTPATSPQTATVTAPAPPPRRTRRCPAISGTATQGQTLTTTNGTWTGSPTSYAYQWQDCDTSGANCTNITGATSSSYTLTAGDVGHTIRVVVTATNPAAPHPRARRPRPPWPPVVVVVVVGGGTPVNSALPSISGTPEPGDTLTATTGSWSASPSGYSYQWYDETTPISGATGSTYTVTSSDIDHTIDVAVTASNASGSSNAAGSNSTGVVVQACDIVASSASAIVSDMQNTANSGKVICAAPGSYNISPSTPSSRP